VIQRAHLTWLAQDGRQLDTIGEAHAYVTPRISPDQARVAVGRLEGRTSDIWILEDAARTLTRLTTNPRRESMPVWSRDSRKLAVATDLGHGGGVELQIVPIATTGRPTTFHTSTFTLRPAGWSLEGRVLFQGIDQRDQVNLWIMSPEAGAEPQAFRADGFNYIQAAISPDGRHVAYASDLSGRFEVYVEDFPTPGNRRSVSNGGATQPRWRPDGKALYYVTLDHYLTARTVTGEPPAFSEPRRLFTLRMPDTNFRLQGANYDVAADGRILAAVLQEEAMAPKSTAMVWLGATAALRQ
jgi:dipeptidyl aminopeptidase/acylaminoacyl peptidase